MNLRVGPFVYRVQFVEGLIEHEGRQCLGLCDNEAHVIHVARHGNEAQQIQVVCHEYMEAWVYHFGQGTVDKEAMCDLFGMAMTQFTLDLMHQMRCWAGAPLSSQTSEETFTASGRLQSENPSEGKLPAEAGFMQGHGSLAMDGTAIRDRMNQRGGHEHAPSDPPRSGLDDSVGLKLRGRWSVRGLGEEGGWRIRLVEPSWETRGMRRVS